MAEERAKWWDPEIKAHRDAVHASSLEGADAASSASAADQRNKASGQELPEEDGDLF